MVILKQISDQRNYYLILFVSTVILSTSVSMSALKEHSQKPDGYPPLSHDSLIVKGQTFLDENGTVFFTGQIVNNSFQTAYNVSLEFFIYDQDNVLRGTLVASNSTTTSIESQHSLNVSGMTHLNKINMQFYSTKYVLRWD
jgi:hypothetical protein